MDPEPEMEKKNRIVWKEDHHSEEDPDSDKDEVTPGAVSLTWRGGTVIQPVWVKRFTKLP